MFKTYLSVVFEPLGSYLWDSVILMLRAVRDATEVSGSTKAHGLEKSRIDWLLKRFCLLYLHLKEKRSEHDTNRWEKLTANSVVFDTEELSLVVTGDGRVTVDVSWQHRQLSGE